ncbi:extradiol dioxygenase [Paenalcaligenes niemegkensis]|uniref:DODA-type extradiol aromatic ring-opening family dioxygenase n=1 Tax=Paenalcaligenes niemegkensis TaxID=2895469 RepID=UPI001EE8DB77|nr:extradiol dioxygenase [Paenalcaligenes niemegkensis]MCQ9617547.1 extradiol dioxygenase [Paenalcaligenes niemegkensis]
MAKIVAAISMSHAPGATGWPEAPEPGMRGRLESIHAELAQQLEEAAPDLIIAFLDDHFENHFRNLMPTFAIGIAQSHAGPADYMIKALGMTKKETIASDPELGETLLRELIKDGFDVARMGEIEYGNNLMTPLKLIRPQFDIPVLPVFTNVFSPPLTTTSRAYALGEAIRRIVEAYPSDMRIAFLATGGLSHWPPVWTSESPEDDEFLQRMKRYQTEGKQVLLEDPHLYEDLCEYEVRMAAQNQYP